jgi:hypothetical protein
VSQDLETLVKEGLVSLAEAKRIMSANRRVNGQAITNGRNDAKDSNSDSDSDSGSSGSESSNGSESSSDEEGAFFGGVSYHGKKLSVEQKRRMQENLQRHKKMVEDYERREQKRKINDLLVLFGPSGLDETTAALQLAKANGNESVAAERLLQTGRSKRGLKRKSETRMKTKLAANVVATPRRSTRTRAKVSPYNLSHSDLQKKAYSKLTNSPGKHRCKNSATPRIEKKEKPIHRLVAPPTKPKTVNAMKAVLKRADAAGERLQKRLGRVSHKATKKCELVSAGKIDLRPKFHNSAYLFPVGYKSKIEYISSKKPDVRCTHICEILADSKKGDAKPVFRITAMDRPSQPLEGKSATAPWKLVLNRINEGRAKRGLDPKKTAIAGPEYFGLNAPDVVARLESLPNAPKCVKYWSGKELLEAQRGLCRNGESYGRTIRERGYRVDRSRSSLPVQQPKNAKKKTLVGAKRAGDSNAETRKRTPAKRARRRRRQEETQIDLPAEHDTYQGYWSTVGRSQRLRNRRKRQGLSTEDLDDKSHNPLADKIDPITLDPIENPAISPRTGHVCGYYTWLMCIKRNGKCPFTQLRLQKSDLVRLTTTNIDFYREKIKGLI